jgi:hypothetical protein
VHTLFIVYFCRCCPRKRKKEKKLLLPTGVSKSTAHTVCIWQGKESIAAKEYKSLKFKTRDTNVMSVFFAV